MNTKSLVAIKKYIASLGAAESVKEVAKKFPSMTEAEADKLVRHVSSKYDKDIKLLKAKSAKTYSRDHSSTESLKGYKGIRVRPNQQVKAEPKAQPKGMQNTTIEYGSSVKKTSPTKAKIDQVKRIANANANTNAEYIKRERAVAWLKKAGVTATVAGATTASAKGTDGDGKDKETKSDMKSETMKGSMMDKLGIKHIPKEKIAKNYDSRQAKIKALKAAKLKKMTTLDKNGLEDATDTALSFGIGGAAKAGTKGVKGAYEAIKAFVKKGPKSTKPVDVAAHSTELTSMKKNLASLKRAKKSIDTVSKAPKNVKSINSDTGSKIARKSLAKHFVEAGDKSSAKSIDTSLSFDKEAMKLTNSPTMKHHFATEKAMNATDRAKLDAAKIKLMEKHYPDAVKPKPEVKKKTLNQELKSNPDLKYHIKDYTGGSSQINKSLLEGGSGASRGDKKIVDGLKTLDKLKKTKFEKLHRGTHLQEEAYKNLKEGDIVNNKAFLSTSKSKDVAEKAFGGADKKLVTFHNTKAHNIENHSNMKFEREALITPEKHFKVKYKDTKNLHLEAMTKDEIKKLSPEQKKKVIKHLMSVGGVSAVAAGTKKKDTKQ